MTWKVEHKFPAEKDIYQIPIDYPTPGHDTIIASWFTDVFTSILAIEDTLGYDVRGGYANLNERISGKLYHSRLIGDVQAGALDFGFADFICDGDVHELDLSSIIPPGTTAVVVNGRWWVSSLDDMMDLVDCSDIGDFSWGDIALTGDSASGYMVFNVIYPVTSARKLLYLFACTILDTFDCGMAITGYFK